MADIAQPGTVSLLATQGKLKPITYARGTMAANFAPAWLALGTYSGKLYALPFKAAKKSVVWCNVPAFTNAGVNPPKTFNQLLTDAKTLKASGTPAYSIGGADGWTLTDMFENIYLRTFGAAKYNQLSQHKIKWTDSSVKTALTSMAKIVGDTGNIAGGSSGALQYGFNDSVTNAFAQPPKAAMVFEADFVGGVITSSTKAKPATGFNTFTWPAITPGANASSVEIGGDLFVTFRDTPAIRAFVNFLATPTAAIAWAKQGGFGTGNKHVAASVYPDPITRATEAPIGQAKPVVYTIIRSFFGQNGFLGTWVGIDNYRTLFTTHTLLTAIKNNAIWVAVVPAFVTAIGLMFAVLTERVRWAVGFKTIVFLPMAISAFATGVTWRIMYQQDPNQGAINALGRSIKGVVSPAGVLPNALPSTPSILSSPNGSLVLKTPLAPGGRALLGLTGIAPDAVPKGGVQAVDPPQKSGDIVGVVWRYFKPGGGKPGVVEKGELGLPGVTVQLRNAAGKTVQSTSTKPNGTFDF